MSAYLNIFVNDSNSSLTGSQSVVFAPMTDFHSYRLLLFFSLALELPLKCFPRFCIVFQISTTRRGLLRIILGLISWIFSVAPRCTWDRASNTHNRHLEPVSTYPLQGSRLISGSTCIALPLCHRLPQCISNQEAEEEFPFDCSEGFFLVSIFRQLVEFKFRVKLG